MSTSGRRPDDLFDGPPQRLIEDPSSPSLLRHDLETAASAAPSYDAAAGLLALQASLGAGAKVAAGMSAAGAAAKTSASVAKSALGLKLAIVGGLSAVAITSAVYLSRVPSSRAPQAERPAAAPAAPQSPSRPAATPEPQPSSPGVVPPPALDEPLAVQPVPSHDTPPVSHVSRDRAAAEIAQLARIKAALEHSPRRALRLAEQGHRQFGEGYLHHEREGLAIIALDALGRDHEAYARAGRFLVRYPHSSLSDRVRALASREHRSAP